MIGPVPGKDGSPETPERTGILYWVLLLYAAGMAFLAVQYIVGQTYLLF